jgi:primosomal protein N' (replication factor Y)
MIYAEIAVNIPQVAGVFHYHLPRRLEGRVHPGHLVVVPFGRQRVQGVVLRMLPEPEISETRPVLDLVDPNLVLTPTQIALAKEMADMTLSPLAECIGVMLPAGLAQEADVLYQVAPAPSTGQAAEAYKPNEIESRLLKLLEKRGPLRGRQIDGALPRIDWRPATRGLERRGLIQVESVLPPPQVRPKSVRTVQLACQPEAAEAELPSLARGGAALARRQAMLRFLLREPGPVEVAWVYAESGGGPEDLNALAERGLVLLGESEVWRDPLAQLEVLPSEPPALTPDQAAAWQAIDQALGEAAAGRPTPPFLLHGVTGSGKTEIYLRAVEACLALGKGAIILVPEIALTPQTVRRFVSRFPGRVGLYHSRLSPGERYDTWRRARLGSISAMVGPRSALFLPFPSLGLIVVDECHDDSYAQEERPFYHARQMAVVYARLAGAVCLLGSATPDIVSRYRADGSIPQWAGQPPYRYLSLPARILAHRQVVQAQVERLGLASHYQPYSGQAETIDLPPVQVVDMRQELKAGNRAIFSRALQAALAHTLKQGQQAILFLNRRGTATYVFCRDCGYVLRCPRCDIPLTYHEEGLRPERASTDAPEAQPTAHPPPPQLICHRCGYERKLPKRCPQCDGVNIRHFGIGTERVEAEVRALFPEARTQRWDSETTRQKGAHEIILSHFASRRTDVLIGTQMVAKGLDLPMVTLVGVVLAEVGLHLPDYRAAERTFNLLTQVAGRAGRSPLGGQVILQTFDPGHYVIEAAARHDDAAFYRKELAYRRQIGYPPFSRLVRLEFRHSDPDLAEAEAQRLAGQVRAWLEAEDRRATEMIGPVPCFFARTGGLYRWQIILRGPDPASLLRNRPLERWQVEVDPVSLL